MKKSGQNGGIERISANEIKDVILNTLKVGDNIHVTKKNRAHIENAPVIFKGAYNNFIMIEAHINNSYMETYTITYADLYTGDTIIHELADQLVLTTEDDCL